MEENEVVVDDHKKQFDSTVTNRLSIRTWLIIISLWITLTGIFVKAIWGMSSLDNQVNITVQKVNIDSGRIDALEKSSLDGKASDEEIKYNLKALLNHFHIQYIQNDNSIK